MTTLLLSPAKLVIVTAPMRILIVSALFPPDVAQPASYVKTLAHELSERHDVTVITYGVIPETIAGVEIITVPKDLPLHRRLWAMFKALRLTVPKNDVVLVNNAPSVEIPAWFASWRTSSYWHLINSDTKICYTGWRKWLRLMTKSKLHTLVLTLPLTRPEQHPFRPPSEEMWTKYTESWDRHLTQLENSIL